MGPFFYNYFFFFVNIENVYVKMMSYIPSEWKNVGIGMEWGIRV
jgi:hypothetical protein